MPAILIDVMRLIYCRARGRIPTGIDRVMLEYVRHYATRARAVLSIGPLAAALSPRDSNRLFRALLEPGDGFRWLAAWLAAKNTAWNWIRPGTGNAVLFHNAHFSLETRGYAAQLRWLGARPVAFIHDLIPIRHPEFIRAGDRGRHLARVRNACAIASGIIVNSRATESELVRHAASAAMRCPPVVVAPLGPGVSALRPPAPPPVTQPYFVVLGTIEPRKNHLLLLHLWRHLAEARGEHPVPRLVVVGQRGWECENVVDLLERCETLKGLIVERNDCSDAELAALLQHARALLMPSFAEGYGLPVVEALAAGTPVIASDLPVFREVAGEVPDYAAPIDGARWLALILDYAGSGSPARRAQLARIEGFRTPSWAQHFDIVERFLESLH